MENNIRTFENDDEFIGFAINITPIFIKHNSGITSYDFDYSTDYNECISNGTLFKINDPKSYINKSKQLNYRFCVKPIDNLAD